MKKEGVAGIIQMIKARDNLAIDTWFVYSCFINYSKLCFP